MKRTIDLSSVETLDELHARLRKALRLSDEYGCNLDALHDVLTESAEPRTLVFKNGAAFWTRFPDFFPRLVQAFLDSQDETEGLDVTFLP